MSNERTHVARSARRHLPAASEADERDLRSAARDVERARTSPFGLGLSSVMRLQRVAGNQATASLLTVHRKTRELDKLMLTPVSPDVSGVAAQEKVVADAGTYWEQEAGGPPSIRAIFVDMKSRTQDWLNDVAGQKK